jgi:hypothetical protein
VRGGKGGKGAEDSSMLTTLRTALLASQRQLAAAWYGVASSFGLPE